MQESLSTEETKLNRRQEQRIAISGLVLQVRRSRPGLKLPYENCESIDMSFNGLAFSMTKQVFNVPDKVDFVLKLEQHEITGTAVICNKRPNRTKTQYGMMFLSVDPELSSIFRHDTFSSEELRKLAEKQAEQLVFSLIDKNQEEARLIVRYQHIFDGCRSYLLRLGEMGMRMSSQSQSDLQPIQAVKIFRGTQKQFILRWYDASKNSQEQMTIEIPENTLNNDLVVNNQIFNGIPQVLDFLGAQLKPQLSFIFQN